ncbi:TPA: hypothetical protein ACSP2N_001946, partial [Aeromonas veronii]
VQLKQRKRTQTKTPERGISPVFRTVETARWPAIRSLFVMKKMADRLNLSAIINVQEKCSK